MHAPPAYSASESSSQSIVPWKRFCLLFAGLMLLHAPLLRLPYFWDEAGYYVPVARDLYLTGSPIPQSTASNAHPPLVMAWLALVWRVFGYSIPASRIAMLAMAAFSLAGLFQLARASLNSVLNSAARPTLDSTRLSSQVAWAVVALTAIYPVFFTQSSLAQVDLPAAGFTFWALAAYLEDRPWWVAIWFSLAALAKETAVIAPMALCAWQIVTPFIRSRAAQLVPLPRRRTNIFHLFFPALPLAGWLAFHRWKTGYIFGNPDFFRYNVAATLNPLRFPIALGLRLWQIAGYFSLYLLTLAAALAMLRSPQSDGGIPRPRIAFWKQAALAVVLLTYLTFMSAVGGAALARYLLPVVPLVILACLATLWRRVRYWRGIAAIVAIAFAAGWFINPPYGFSLEDNLEYRNFILMHEEASHFLRARYPHAVVLTAWPASDEITRPWLGYVDQPFRVVRIEDFTSAQIDMAAARSNDFDAAFVFSTKYQPPHDFLVSWTAWQHIKEKFFGYHRDLLPDEIARRLGGQIVFREEKKRLWVAVIALDREQDARLRAPR
ncbi:MAG: glycosyltransferase [Terriglobales bacterium]